jgi:hypothetical protein
MSRQLRFDTPAELATKMIAKLSQDELNVTTRALIVHINDQIPVKQNRTSSDSQQYQG